MRTQPWGQLTYGTTDTRMRDTPRAERVTATDDDDDVKRSSVYEDEDSGLIGTGQRQQRSYERQQQSYRRRTIGCWVVAALLLVSVGLNLFMAGGSGGSELSSQQQTSFSVSYTAAAAAASDESAAAALDGRVYLLLSSLAAPEPRFQVREVAASCGDHRAYHRPGCRRNGRR
jgi:multidrug efflux pump subunit AcrB